MEFNDEQDKVSLESDIRIKLSMTILLALSYVGTMVYSIYVVFS